MTPTRRKRFALVGLILLGVSAATAIAITALNDSMRFSIGPSEVMAGEFPEGRQLRLGGLVANGSIRRSESSLAVDFEVTDCLNEVPVTFTGILPDLFREGQGVIAHGQLAADGVFHAHEVLARHDESYMPPEVDRALAMTGSGDKCEEAQ